MPSLGQSDSPLTPPEQRLSADEVAALKRRIDELEYAVGKLAYEAMASFTGYVSSPRLSYLRKLAGNAPAKGGRS